MGAHCWARRSLAWIRRSSAVACLLVAGPAVAAQLTLTWTDNATNESDFRIERRLSPSGTYSEIASVALNVTTYTDTAITDGQEYCYRVRAHNTAGNSGYSGEACGTALTVPPPPPPPLVTLTVAKSGTGTVTGAGISCGSDCTEAVASGSAITLTAAAGPGFAFTGWSGGGCTGTSPCTVTVTANTTVTATFTPTVTLTVSKSGTGTVTGTGISCGSDCTEAVASGSAITLTAAAGPGFAFTGWSGGGCTGTSPCTVTVTANTTVTATFTPTVTLTVSKTGTGTVTGAGISCGSDCTEAVASGSAITLTAAAGPGFAFTGWSGGGCTGTSPCTVTVTAATTVTATFTPTVTLTVSKTGTGTVTGAGISCGSDCTEAVASGSAITLTAAAGPGFAFTGWSGGGCTGTSPCAVTVTAATTVTATFAPTVTLTVAKSGTGTVTGTGISCGSDCTEAVASGSAITLTAAAGPGFAFTGWSGGGCTGTSPCTVTVTANTTVTATFTPTVTLTVSKSGTGTVTGTGISCGSDCTEAVSSGSAITLTAAAGPGFVFTGWSGGGCTGTSPCAVTVTANTTVTATFTPTVTLTVSKSGTGTVTGAGISCGSDCTEAVASGSAITLTAAAGPGFVFTGWSGGGCTGTSPCAVTVTANTTVTATFTPTVTLTVSKTGLGTVTGPGISCGDDCTHTVPSGTPVTLVATPGAGAAFAGWGGGGCGGAGDCTVMITADTTVTAPFTGGPLVQFSLANYSVSEAGPPATITVTRAAPTATQVQVHFETSDGTAVAGTHYTSTEGDLVFLPGQTSKTFTIPVANNTLVDGSRTILLRLSAPQNAQLGAQQTAVLTIQDDDGGGTVRFSAAGYTYPDNAGYATITVTRSGGTAGGASVKYRTGPGGTAVAGTDYISISAPQTLVFNANETSKTFWVRVLGNSVATDSNKTVEIVLTDPAGGAALGAPNAALLTITNNDSGGGLRFSASAFSASEGASHATVTVTRASGAASGVSVKVVAVDGSAKGGIDYGAPTPSPLSFAAGETSKTVEVPLLANPLATASRSLTLKLQSPAGGATLSSPSSATLTITKAGIRFGQTAYAVNEGPGSASITVVRAGSGAGVTVQVQTLDDSARAPADYTAISPPQTLTFSSGQTSKTATVAIANNPGRSVNRSLRLRLLNAAGEPLGKPDEATLTILDKELAELELTAFAPPPVGLAGKTIAVPTTVRNLSARSAGSSALRFVLSSDAIFGNADDVFLGARAVGGLGGGASSTATTTLTIPAATGPGNHTLFAIVDVLNAVPEQDEANNVGAVPLTVVSSLVRTFGVSGVLTQEGCTSSLRNGRVAVRGSVAFSTQAGASLTGTLTLTFPLAPGAQTSGPIQATLDTTGHLAGTFTYTTKQGSAVVSTGTGSLTGTVNGPSLDLEAVGHSTSGETCDFAAALIAPAIPVTFMAFHHDTTAGSLGESDGAFVAIPSFPASITRYRVLFTVAGEAEPFSPPATVFFTGPGGSSLSDTGGAELAQLATGAAEYRSPFVSSPSIAPAGAWTVEHDAQYYDYAMADPAAVSRLVVPVPTFGQVNGQLQQVTWAYRAPTGAPLPGSPSFVRAIRLQILDPCGAMLHDSLTLVPTTASRTLTPAVPLASVAEVRFRYGDDRENVYTVRYGGATPGTCKVVEFSAPSFSAGEHVTPASVTVRRVGDLSGTVTVNFTTSDGTAHAGQDYTNANQVLTLAPGVTTRVVGVPLLDNGTPEGPRTVLLGLSGAGGGAGLGPLRTAVLTINDDEPRVRFSSATYAVDEQTSTATITVQRTGATSPVVSVPYSTGDGTALAGVDYQGQAGVLTFAAGQTSKTFTVRILDDTLAEGGQTVNLSLGSPTGAALSSPATAVLTVTDNDGGGTLAFASPAFSVSEDAGIVAITVVRTGGKGGDVTVRYATSDGTGQAGADYDARSGTLTFGTGETSKTFTVPVHVNAGAAMNKSVTLTLSSPSIGAALGTPRTATLWIVSQ